MDRLDLIYQKLLSSFGSQRWWPVTVKGHSPSYCGGPRSEKHRFEVIVGAILTQNTAWKNVEKAISNLNKNKLIDVDKLAKINQSRLAKLIRSAGYYNQKAERLKIIAEHIRRNYAGSIKRLFDRPVGQLRQELLSIKGIGPETADSIILYSAGKPIFVIDAYTKRIFSRIGMCKEDCRYDELQNFFHKKIKRDEKIYNEYHALLVELAKRNCRKKPICEDCPIKRHCGYPRQK